MGTYQIILYVNGRRTIVTVAANTMGAAQRIAKDQFYGSKVSIFSTRKVA